MLNYSFLLLFTFINLHHSVPVFPLNNVDVTTYLRVQVFLMKQLRWLQNKTLDELPGQTVGRRKWRTSQDGLVKLHSGSSDCRCLNTRYISKYFLISLIESSLARLHLPCWSFWRGVWYWQRRLGSVQDPGKEEVWTQCQLHCHLQQRCPDLQTAEVCLQQVQDGKKRLSVCQEGEKNFEVSI